MLLMCTADIGPMVSGLFAPRYFRSSERKFPVGTFAPRNEGPRELLFPGAILVENHSIFLLPQYFCPLPEEGVPLELGTGTGEQKCELWSNGRKEV